MHRRSETDKIGTWKMGLMLCKHRVKTWTLPDFVTKDVNLGSGLPDVAPVVVFHLVLLQLWQFVGICVSCDVCVRLESSQRGKRIRSLSARP